MRLFFDANVILDVLTRREPWYDHSAAVLSLVEGEGFDGFVAAHTVTTVSYLTRKHRGQDGAATAVVSLLDLVTAVAVDQDVLLKAFGYGWPDVEDAVQAVCAIACGADYFVTRDVKIFRDLSVLVVAPAELLAILQEPDDVDEAASRPGNS